MAEDGDAPTATTPSGSGSAMDVEATAATAAEAPEAAAAEAAGVVAAELAANGAAEVAASGAAKAAKAEATAESDENVMPAMPSGQLSEAEVGMGCFLNDCAPFAFVFRERYTDFIVHEVDLEVAAPLFCRSSSAENAFCVATAAAR